VIPETRYARAAVTRCYRRGVGGRFKRPALMLVAVGCIAASCGSDPSTDDSAGNAPTTASDVATPSLVGTWERETRCDELVTALDEAGLDDWVLEFVAGNGFIPGVRRPDQIGDPGDACDGAVPRIHSHFFTEDGMFGSLNWKGNQVDDGTYVVTDDGTFVVSKEFPDVTFNYSIEDDTISFDPAIPDCSPECFEAAWSVSVAYPGETWTRATS
jgi:hypothetical protein